MKIIYNTDDVMYSKADLLHAFRHAYYLGKAPTEHNVEKALNVWVKEYSGNTLKKLTLADIINAVIWRTGVSYDSINGESSKKNTLSLARQYICWFAYHYTDILLEAIAFETKAKDHPTVLNRSRAINEFLAVDKNVIRDVEAIKAMLICDGYELNFILSRHYIEYKLEEVCTT